MVLVFIETSFAASPQGAVICESDSVEGLAMEYRYNCQIIPVEVLGDFLRVREIMKPFVV